MMYIKSKKWLICIILIVISIMFQPMIFAGSISAMVAGMIRSNRFNESSTQSDENFNSTENWNVTKAGSENVLDIIYNETVIFCYCPPGSFNMGLEEEQHKVTLTKGFWMLQTEVSQRLWEEVMGYNPSEDVSLMDSVFPVESVSWDDCQSFIEKLNSLNIAPSGWKFSLPTEAQWEYACRAGTTTPFAFGESLSENEVNYRPGGRVKYVHISPYAPVPDYSNMNESFYSYSIKPIYYGKPNNWGLYNMHGNVRELCIDYFDSYPSSAQTDPCCDRITPEIVRNRKSRVVRGGSYDDDSGCCKSGARSRLEQYNHNECTGFRVVLIRQ